MKFRIQSLCVAVLALSLLICACGEKDLSGTGSSLDPENGPVIAVIDGEDFHYSTTYLFFHNLSYFSEDPKESLPEYVVQGGDYGEMAIGYELLYREAMAKGFERNNEAIKKDKEGFYSFICEDGFLNALEDADLDTARKVDKLMQDVKDEYQLESDEALADRTYDIYKKGSYASSYYITLRSPVLGYNSDPEANREFWLGVYEDLLEKYHVEIKYK